MQPLPAEIIDGILGYIDVDLERRTLKNVRRTCWTLAHAAAPHLFQKVSVWLERDSLQKLVDYSEHPLYSQCISQITLGTERLNPYGFLVQDPTLRQKRLLEHLEYQKQLEKGGLDIKVLSAAMKRLPKLSTIVFGNANTSPTRCLLAREGFAVVEPGSAWRRHVLQVGLQALLQAGCKPRAIVVSRDWRTNNWTPSWAFNDLRTLVTDAQLCALVQNLRVFYFSDGNGSCKDYSKRDIRHDGTLGWFLENAYQVEDIRLAILGNIGQDTLRALVGRAHYRRLRKVTFSFMQFCDRDLTKWLLLHSASLEQIQLKYVHVRKGQWDHFLDALRPEPWANLAYVNLERVTCRPESGSDGGNENWNWAHGSAPLVEYIKGESDSNPYHIYHPGWFPELFGPSSKAGVGD